MPRRPRYVRHRNVSKQVAQERSRKGGLSRTTPDYYITKLELGPVLTEDQRRRLAALAAGDAA